MRNRYHSKEGMLKGYCTRCEKYYLLSNVPIKAKRHFCPKHGIQLRLKPRSRNEKNITRY